MKTAQTLKDFSDQHGIRFIARRHFEYRLPVPVIKTANGNNAGEIGSMVYTRHLAPEKLGLNAMGTLGAIMHGEKLGAWGLIPSVIMHGRDQRNFDGAWLTAESLPKQNGKQVSCLEHPGVTYPVYRDVEETARALKEHGDTAIHMIYAGRLESLWTESAIAFRVRIEAAIKIPQLLVLWDLNFEAIVLLYYIHVYPVRALREIPCNSMAWMPQKGGGIVVGIDGRAAAFDRNFDLLE